MKSIVALLLFILTCSGLSAQNNNSGIYSSWQDYNSNKLSVVCNCNSSDKIEVHHLFHKSYVDIIQNGKQTRLCKDSVFGYRDCRQHDFRFYGHDTEYEIVENRVIVIYRKDIATTASTGKVTDYSAHYFFSKGPDAIFPLTILNLKKEFPDNLKFHNLLDVTFGDGTVVSAYDSEHTIYKVNFLLNKSLQNQ